MQIGYARVSTVDQSLNLQEDALKASGCEKVFQDVVSGGNFERDGLKAALVFLREGDVLVVWKLDRLGRSARWSRQFAVGRSETIACPCRLPTADRILGVNHGHQ